LGATALGLGISRKLVRLLGGEVGLETPPGKGPSLWFRLPLDKQLVAKSPEREAVQLRGVRVLVVDPSPSARQSPLEMLAAWGCPADKADNGEEARERPRSTAGSDDPYRVAIVDLQLPDVDGLEVGRRIRSERDLDTTSLMMLTALGSRGDAARAQAAG